MDAGRLFHLHLNDNSREFDWDMLPASVNLWDFLEILYYLDKYNCNIWCSYDVIIRRGNLIKQIQITIDIINLLQSLLEKIGNDELRSLIDGGIPSNAFGYLIRSLL